MNNLQEKIATTTTLADEKTSAKSSDEKVIERSFLFVFTHF